MKLFFTFSTFLIAFSMIEITVSFTPNPTTIRVGSVNPHLIKNFETALKTPYRYGNSFTNSFVSVVLFKSN